MSSLPETRWRCSVAAAERADDPVGTAVPAPRWMLVGHPGPWTDKAATTPPVLDVRPPLVRALDAVQARLQLIRPHGRVDSFVAPWPVLLVDSDRRRIVRATWREPSDLVALAERFTELVDTAPDDPDDLVVLVCCHGKKDPCCAVEGRVVARVLDDAVPGAVWETTHLGGDRFAGNIALLPEGSMYGRLDGTSAPDVVIGHLDGEVDLARWRGRTTWGSPEQVAVHSVMRDEGVALADVAAVTSAALDGSTWEVEVAAADRTYRRTVARTFSEPRRLTCGLDLKVMAQWSVVGGSR